MDHLKHKTGNKNTHHLFCYNTISIAYDRTYEEIVNRYVMARFGVNLLRPSLSEELIYNDKEHATLHRKLQAVLEQGDDLWKNGIVAAIHAFHNSVLQDSPTD